MTNPSDQGPLAPRRTLSKPKPSPGQDEPAARRQQRLRLRAPAAAAADAVQRPAARRTKTGPGAGQAGVQAAQPAAASSGPASARKPGRSADDSHEHRSERAADLRARRWHRQSAAPVEPDGPHR